MSNPRFARLAASSARRTLLSASGLVTAPGVVTAPESSPPPVGELTAQQEMFRTAARLTRLVSQSLSPAGAGGRRLDSDEHDTIRSDSLDKLTRRWDDGRSLHAKYDDQEITYATAGATFTWNAEEGLPVLQLNGVWLDGDVLTPKNNHSEQPDGSRTTSG